MGMLWHSIGVSIPSVYRPIIVLGEFNMWCWYSWQFSPLELSSPFPMQSVGTVLSSDIPSAAESEEDEDGMNDMNEEVMSLIWSEDLRVQEVRRLLQSARPVRVNVVQTPEASDHEYIEEKENR